MLFHSLKSKCLCSMYHILKIASIFLGFELLDVSVSPITLAAYPCTKNCIILVKVVKTNCCSVLLWVTVAGTLYESQPSGGAFWKIKKISLPRSSAISSANEPKPARIRRLHAKFK
jgi:hypothetical protein